jgi:hypothetical protein
VPSHPGVFHAQVIHTHWREAGIAKPSGILWHKLSPEKLSQIRVLQQLKEQIEQQTGQPLPTGERGHGHALVTAHLLVIICHKLVVALIICHKLFVTLVLCHKLFVTLVICHHLFVTLVICHKLFVTLIICHKLFVITGIICHKSFVTIICHKLLCDYNLSPIIS